MGDALSSQRNVWRSRHCSHRLPAGGACCDAWLLFAVGCQSDLLLPAQTASPHQRPSLPHTVRMGNWFLFLAGCPLFDQHSVFARTSKWLLLNGCSAVAVVCDYEGLHGHDSRGHFADCMHFRARASHVPLQDLTSVGAARQPLLAVCVAVYLDSDHNESHGAWQYVCRPHFPGVLHCRHFGRGLDGTLPARAP